MAQRGTIISILVRLAVAALACGVAPLRAVDPPRTATAVVTGGGVPAEPESAPARPTVGVAFSGGGAKGCAEVGVLRVLEELRVPVDYAAGTSMGAIVGGLYASGMGVDELEAVLFEVDWADALVDKPGRQDLSYRRKDDDLRYLSDLELGIGRDGLRFPTGLRGGQKLNFLLRRLTLPVRTVTDFDRLPIPFRAIATDIANGEMVVIDHGDLALALRASMAIPTVFSPVAMGGRLLVDGGVSNNVPVDVVRAMGADTVVAIDIGSPLTAPDEVRRSYLKILGQTLGFITRANMAPRLAAADVVVTPPVGGFGTLAFERCPEIVALGEAEARAIADTLRPLALSEADYQAWRADRRRVPDPLPAVTAVRVEGNQRVDSRALLRLVQLAAGSPLSLEVVRDDLGRLYGLGAFASVDVELEANGGGTAVVYRVVEKPWGPTYLRTGLGLELDLEGDNDTTLLVGINRTRLNALGAEWKTDLQLGPARSIQTGLFQPLSFDSGWFVEPSLRYERKRWPLFVDDARAAELDVRSSRLRLDFGYLFGSYGEARVGLERGWVEAREDSGAVPDTLRPSLGRSIDRGGVALSAVVDRLDNAKLPKHGGLARITAFAGLEALGAEDEYTKVELRLAGYHTRHRHTLFAHASGGGSPGSSLPVYERFPLGGLFSLAGFAPGELTGDNYAVLRAGYYYRLTKLFHVGGFGEAARASDELSSLVANPVLTATALLVADTPAGPLYVGLSAAERGRRAVYILYGRLF